MVPAVKSFLDTNPIGADFGKTWTRLLPASRYPGPDAGPGESPPDGWTAEFPHPLTGENGRPDSSFQAQWERSPFADAYLARLAASLTESFELGQSERLDVLGVSFSTPDLVGHGFGPQSHEVQDIYAHLDRAIGELLARLDTLVGRGRYVVALASDHGVSTLPEQSKQATGEEGGRLRATRVRDTVERAAQAAGAGRYVSRVYGNDVYFEAGAYEKLEAMPAARALVIERLLAEPGIARVFTREELLEGARAQDAMLRAAALSYVPRLSGDMLLVLRPGWMFTASGTTHGTPNPYDQRVPVIFMGPGVKAGVYDDAVTPADVAPTLAALTGIELPRAEGRPLTGALTPGRP
jgi:predicted AlkP superfamily pyrophosphatase or phosphodiesterase